MQKRHSKPKPTPLKYIYTLALWLFLFAVPASAQYDSLVHKPYAERIDGYVKLYLELLALKDSAAIAQRTEKVKQFAREKKDRDLEIEMDLFLVYHDAFFKKLPPARSIAAIQELIDRSEKEKIDHITIRLIRILAQYYWEQQSYEKAFEQYMLLDKKLSTQNVHDFPELVRDLLKIGEAYYFFHDYGQAKHYFEKIIQLPETDFNSMFMNSARNTLGLCYQKEKDYKRSDYYFNQILKTNFAEPKKVWRRIAMGNLGANYYYRKAYIKAIPLLEYDFAGALKENDYGPAAGASTLLADIYLSRGDLKKSWDYLTQARITIAKAEQPDRLQYLYPIMSKWYSSAGKNNLSRIYLDSTVVAINSYRDTYNARKVLRAQQKISLQEMSFDRLNSRWKSSEKQTSETPSLSSLPDFVALSYWVILFRKKGSSTKI